MFFEFVTSFLQGFIFSFLIEVRFGPGTRRPGSNPRSYINGEFGNCMGGDHPYIYPLLFGGFVLRRGGFEAVVLCGGFVGDVLFEAVFGYRRVIFETWGFESGDSPMHAYSHRGRSD